MLETGAHGEVTELRFTTTIVGRAIYSVSAFLFDGTLIDTGPPRTGPELAAWVRELSPSQRVTQIVNTHQHEDHVGGNAYLPDIPAWAPEAALPVLRQAPRIPFYRWTTFGQPRPAEAQPLGERVETSHHTLEVIPTPGHAPGHVALLLPERGWLFGGDLYIMERANYVRRIDDVGRWLASLRHILSFEFETLFCGHSGRVADGKAAIKRKIAYWEGIRAQAQELAGRGYGERAIRSVLLGREGFLTYWSTGRFAKRNLIRALLAIPDEEEVAPAPAQG